MLAPDGIVHHDKRMDHVKIEQLEAGLPHILESPGDDVVLELVIRRPAVDDREVLDTAELTFADGVAGDTWNQRGSKRTEDSGPHPDMQLNIMNARVTALLAQSRDHWPLAGDQLYVDFDITENNVPAGTRLAIGVPWSRSPTSLTPLCEIHPRVRP